MAPGSSLRRWHGPYVRALPSDPWGNPYLYRQPGAEGKAFDLTSYGRDGRPGGGDDITN